MWNALGMPDQGCGLALTGKVTDAVQLITSGLAAIAGNRSDILVADGG